MRAFVYRWPARRTKLAIIVDDGSIALAKDGRPTTHILKPIIQALEGTVENEYFRMGLAARLKLPGPHVEIHLSGVTAFLLVERYDRMKAADGIIERLHPWGNFPRRLTRREINVRCHSQNPPFRRVISISLHRERATIFFGPSPMLPEPSTTDTGTNDTPSMGASPGSESFVRPISQSIG
jgi:hypothetical protein